MAKPDQDQLAVPLRPTTRSLPIALLRARETVMEPIRDMLAKSQISEQKWRILRVVDERGPVEQTAIAKDACLLLPSLTRLIAAMEQDQLIHRSPDPKDKRRSMVRIADKGRALIDTHAPESQDIFTRLENQFGHKDLEHLLDLLEKLQDVKL